MDEKNLDQQLLILQNKYNNISMEELLENRRKQEKIILCNKIYFLLKQKDLQNKIKPETIKLLNDNFDPNLEKLTDIYQKILGDTNLSDEMVEKYLGFWNLLVGVTAINDQYAAITFPKKPEFLDQKTIGMEIDDLS